MRNIMPYFIINTKTNICSYWTKDRGSDGIIIKCQLSKFCLDLTPPIWHRSEHLNETRRISSPPGNGQGTGAALLVLQTLI